MKGVSTIIAAVFVILISITGVTLTIQFAIPILERGNEAAVFTEAQRNMQLLDSLIKEVASENLGALRTFNIRVTDGEYRINPTGESIEYVIPIKSGFLPKGSVLQEGNLRTAVTGSATAKVNSTHLILENEVLEVVQPRIGNGSSFTGINTSSAISTIRLKDSGATLVPTDARIIIGNITNTSWGLGYSKVAFEGSDLPSVESIFHVRSNLTNTEYEVVYRLQASTDFLLINVRNVSSSNKTTIVLSYKLGGDANNDIIRIGDTVEGSFKPIADINSSIAISFTNTNYTVNSSVRTLNVSVSTVYYNASDGSWRNISELWAIGQGNWTSVRNASHTNITTALAGADGWDFGIRDSLVGGSYWLNENGTSLESGLVGYWKFAEGKGNATKDSSGNGNDGTISNGPLWITNSSCKIGNCLFFDGLDDFVSLPDTSSLKPTTAVTVSEWIYLYGTTTTDIQTGFIRTSDLTQGYLLFVDSSNSAKFAIAPVGSRTDTNGFTLSSGRWYHLVGTWDGTNLKLYVDGVERGSASQSSIAYTGASGIIGRADLGNLGTNATIDEVRIYNRALSADEVKRLYTSTAIKIQNDFLTANVEPYIQMNLTNYTGGSIFTQSTESIILDSHPITSNYSINDTTVYFFDWKENDWKIWQRNDYVDALKAWWKLDDGSGTSVTDSGKSGTTGTFSSTPTWITNSSCKIGSCLSFDGGTGGDYISLGTGNPTTKNSVTLSAWVNVRSAASPGPHMVIVGKGLGGNYIETYALMSTSGKFRFTLSNDTGSSNDIDDSADYSLNRWYHVVGTFDGVTAKLYVDGVLKNSSVVTGISINSAEPLRIGALSDSSASYGFQGLIDEVKIWDRAITSQEVLAEFRNTKRGMPDWLDPRFKQQFKWKQEFKKNGLPNINITYSMTAHDPYIRTFVDTGPVGYAGTVDNSSVGYWQFNEGSGTSTRDESGKNSVGTFVSTVTWITNASCKIGNCLLFGGNANPGHVSISENSRNNITGSQITISAWVNANASQVSASGIVTKAQSYLLLHMATGTVRLYLSNSTTDNFVEDPATLPINALTHIAATYDGRTMKIYRNGILKGTTAHSGNINATTAADLKDVRIGTWAHGSNYNGYIDEVRIWDRALTPEEVNEEYQRGLNHNITLKVSLGEDKSRMYVKSRPNADTPNGYYSKVSSTSEVISMLNSTGGYTISSNGASSLSWSTFNLTSPLVAFANKISNDMPLLVTLNFRPGINARKDFLFAANDSSLSNAAGYDGFWTNYVFNATTNNNFILSLGYAGRVSTSGWGGDPSGGANSAGGPDNTTISFSNETMESLANSTLTYYDLKDNSLVGWWKFNLGGNVSVDSSDFNNTGKFEGSTIIITNSSCKSGFGYCMSFTDSASRINITDSPSLKPSKITVMGWFKTSSTARGNILTKRFNPDDQASYGIETNIVGIGNDGGTGKITWYIHDGSVAHYAGSESSSLNDGKWHHAAGTFDGNVVRLYVDGVLQAPSGTGHETTNPIYYPGTPTLQPLIIGSNLNGLVDDVKIYSRALSNDEIKAAYLAAADDYPNFGKTNQTGGATSIPAVSFYYDGGAVGIWKFDEGSGSNATDASGNGNHGRIKNVFWVTNSSCKSNSCLHFNGTDGNVSIPDNADLRLNGKWSLEFWARVDGDTSGTCCPGFMNKGAGGSSGQGYLIFRANSDRSDPNEVYYKRDNVQHWMGTVTADKKWHHFIVTHNGNVIRTYLDGNLKTSTNVEFATNSLTNNLEFGMNVGGAHLNGSLDEIRFYSRVLTDFEVKEHYKTGTSKYYDDFATSTGKTYRFVGVEDSSNILQPATPNGTVLHLRFNDNSTVNVTDSSSHGNNGRLTTSNVKWITNASCRANLGGCVYLPGNTNDYVTVSGNHLQIRSGITVAAWVNMTADDTILNKGWANGYSLITQSGLPTFAVTDQANNNKAQATTNIVANGGWYHVVGTYDKQTISIYVNGVLEGTDAYTQDITDLTTPWRIGSNDFGGSGKLLVDEVIIVNRSLNANEVYQLYVGGANRTISGRNHRIVSADDLNSISFNLTAKNNSFDYSTRVLLINGTERPNSTTPVPSCYTASQLVRRYACSYDNQEFSSAKAVGLIHSGSAGRLDTICNDESYGRFMVNLTSVGQSQTILPFTNGVCTDIGNKTNIIERQGVPSSVLGSVTVAGEAKVQLTLLYDRIKIQGTGRIGKGSHKICIEKVGSELQRAIVNVTVC